MLVFHRTRFVFGGVSVKHLCYDYAWDFIQSHGEWIQYPVCVYFPLNRLELKEEQFSVWKCGAVSSAQTLLRWVTVA